MKLIQIGHKKPYQNNSDETPVCTGYKNPAKINHYTPRQNRTIQVVKREKFPLLILRSCLSFNHIHRICVLYLLLFRLLLQRALYTV
jgi:hypothetical protein